MQAKVQAQNLYPGMLIACADGKALVVKVCYTREREIRGTSVFEEESSTLMLKLGQREDLVIRTGIRPDFEFKLILSADLSKNEAS